MSESKLQAMNQNKELQKWISLVAECRSSGMSVKEWCQGKDFCVQTYYRWQRRVFDYTRQNAAPAFIEVTPPKTAPRAAVATLRTTALDVDLYSGIDTEALHTICQVLKIC